MQATKRTYNTSLGIKGSTPDFACNINQLNASVALI